MVYDIIFRVLFALLGLFGWALILSAVVSTLISFGVLDTRNRLVWSAADFLYRVTEPALRPLRAIMPNFGNIDLSPLVALLLLKLVVGPILAELQSGLEFGIWHPLFSAG